MHEVARKKRMDMMSHLAQGPAARRALARLAAGVRGERRLLSLSRAAHTHGFVPLHAQPRSASSRAAPTPPPSCLAPRARDLTGGHARGESGPPPQSAPEASNHVGQVRVARALCAAYASNSNHCAKTSPSLRCYGEWAAAARFQHCNKSVLLVVQRRQRRRFPVNATRRMIA